MRASSRFYLLNSFVFVIVCFLLYFVLINRRLETEQLRISDVLFEPSKEHSNVDYNVWLIFTKVTNKSTLTFKFQNLISNLLNVSTVPLKFHIIVDEKSKTIAKYKLSEVVYTLNKSLVYTFYNVQDCSTKLSDIVNVMTPFFSSRPGTYFSDALFYISLGLYRIAPSSQKRGILLDCDLYFKKDIALLFDEFDRFKPTAFYGLAPELTPVYRHILHMYKLKHNTTFGDYYRDNDITEGIHPHGFQGYNSGVVLIDFEKQRESKQYLQVISRESIKNMTEKYRFRGHLGDQDFYTLLGYEHPDLIQTLNCGFNRQLCTWWKDHGYSDIFKHYFQCNHSIVVLHGNCNSRIPKD